MPTGAVLTVCCIPSPATAVVRRLQKIYLGLAFRTHQRLRSDASVSTYCGIAVATLDRCLVRAGVFLARHRNMEVPLHAPRLSYLLCWSGTNSLNRCPQRMHGLHIRVLYHVSPVTAHLLTFYTRSLHRRTPASNMYYNVHRREDLQPFQDNMIK